jgi:hypothetical protein
MSKLIKIEWWGWELGKAIQPMNFNLEKRFKIVKRTKGFVYLKKQGVI